MPEISLKKQKTESETHPPPTPPPLHPPPTIRKGDYQHIVMTEETISKFDGMWMCLNLQPSALSIKCSEEHLGLHVQE